MVGQKESEITPGVPKRTIASIYNPDLLPKEQLIRTFVVRVKKFEKLFADIKSSKMEHPEQPVLIVGLRGMGKTTLLLRLAYEVENDPELNTWLLPIVFNEEEYGVTRLFKFWETVAQYLEQKDTTFAGLYDEMDRAYEIEPDPVKYEKTAFELLLLALRQHEKKLLLFIDNFGDMFQRFNKQEKQRLREVLTTCPDLRIIAGSSVAAESFFKYGDPFYELFKIEQLSGLSRKETETFLLHLGEHYPQNPVKEILEKQPGRIETLRRLTGGIPRTIVLLFEIFVDDKNGDAFTDLERILDSVTPLYKHRMDDLKPQQQEIINALAHSWDAVSAKEVAQKTRLSSKLVSAQLKQLKQNNLVDIQRTNTKNHLYLLHDRFFNIWYLMRMARRGDRKRVLWLVRFLEQWCDEEQLSKRAKSLLSALNRGGYHTKGAFYFSTALYYAEKHDLDTRYALSKQSQRYFKGKDSALHEEASRSDMAFFGRAIGALKRRDVEGACEELMAIRDKDAQDYLLLSALCRHQGDPDQANSYYEQALKLKIEHPERVMGDVFCDYLRDYGMAERYYREAVEKGDIKAIRRLGWMYRDKLKDQEKAEELYREALEKEDTRAWGYLADLYRDEKKEYIKAEEYYLKAALEGHATALRQLGWMCENNLKDLPRAEQCYREAINRGNTESWRYLADLYHEGKKDYIKAEGYYRKAVLERHTEALYLLGWMYEDKLKNIQAAEELYREAIENGETFAWGYLGDLYRDHKKEYIKAEEYYHKAIEQGHYHNLRFLGWMYEDKLKNFEKAEKLYFEAAENGDEKAWYYLGDLYSEKLKRYEKAEEFYLKYKEHNQAEGSMSLAELYEEHLDHPLKAEEYYLEAVEAGDLSAYNELAWMLFKRHLKPKEALIYAEKAYESIQENYVAHTLACVLLWSGEAERAKTIGLSFLYNEAYLEEDDDKFLFQLLLLAKEEYPFLYDYFTGEKGREFQLKDRFKPLWYALMYYLQDEYPTEYLRMPPEIRETVEEVIARVEQMRADYTIEN